MSTLRELELERISPHLLEILRREGYASLSEFQKSALDSGLMRDRSIILQTHDFDEAYKIGEIALLNRVASDFRARGIVLCQNPHQAEKRLVSVSRKCNKLGIRVTPIIRRRTATGTISTSGRVIVATIRSLAIGIQSQPDLLNEVKSVLIERIDRIGQPHYGATLEEILVRIMGTPERVQYIATCPLVADMDDLSRWLKADVVEDSKAELKRIFSVKAFDSMAESLADLAEFVHYKEGQIMILCSDIDSAEELAYQLTGLDDVHEEAVLDLRLLPEDRDELTRLTQQIGRHFPDCELTENLRDVVVRGVAFFHEGVPRIQRRIISEAWEDRILPVLVMPTRFAIASGLRATVVFLLGVYMKDEYSDIAGQEEVTMISELQLSDVLGAAGRPSLDNEGFGIVVVGSKTERERVLQRYLVEGEDGNIHPRPGEVDSSMDDPENFQDLVLSQLCSTSGSPGNPFSILDRTYWASSKRRAGFTADLISPVEDANAETLIELRSSKSTRNRAEDIPDSSVRVVSVTPSKIEGLVHSGSRELWHFVTLRVAEGVSCSCEAWKYQGVSKHRLCKHLVKFSRFALDDEDTRPYAASVIEQALRGLSLIDELERDGLVVREGDQIKCTRLGDSVARLGVPVSDARQALKALSGKKGDLHSILKRLLGSRTGLSYGLISDVLSSIPAESMEEVGRCAEHMPGVVENLVEETQYVNSILLSLMSTDKRDKLSRESLELQQSLMNLLEEDT
ncbi:hypothetical protein EU545_04255 [Candidatus Thorarchaeota archaeon]|nr:MAG: hypothetical protein EU545_04255 [Candidatus Thorarchaeota archaeon]